MKFDEFYYFKVNSWQLVEIFEKRKEEKKLFFLVLKKLVKFKLVVSCDKVLDVSDKQCQEVCKRFLVVKWVVFVWQNLVIESVDSIEIYVLEVQIRF